MPPNIIDLPIGPDPEIMTNGVKTVDYPKSYVSDSKPNNTLIVFQSSLTLVAHIFVGITVGSCLLYSFRTGLPLGPTPLHIVLCVIGYQLLMAEAFLVLSENSWANGLKLIHKRRIHWILQILGSGLGIIGSIIKIVDKSVNWNTLHGQFALVAMVFTSVSLVNGLTSLYAYELRGIIPGTLSKLSHICFGIVAFVAACISLCYGFDKHSYRNWVTNEMAHASITIVAGLTFIAIVNPLISFSKKSLSVIKK